MPGDVTADDLLRKLRATPNGLTRAELSNHFARNKSADEISRALDVLLQHGSVRFEKADAETGRPAERWFAIRLSTKETNLTKEVTGEGR
jgi:hypothetical protein